MGGRHATIAPQLRPRAVTFSITVRKGCGFVLKVNKHVVHEVTVKMYMTKTDHKLFPNTTINMLNETLIRQTRCRNVHKHTIPTETRSVLHFN